jgi:2-phosphosulfolactate phosphatase
MIVEVAPLPSALLEVERKVAIVVDALRASSTIVAMFEAGAQAVIVAASADEALRLASLDRERYLICGEVNGMPPAGFDRGNSPSDIATLDLAGQDVILSTSNGTRALRAVVEAPLTLVGTGRNASALASAALAAAERASADLVVVCAGDELGTIFSLEDFYFAGLLVDRIANQRPFIWPVDESNPRSGDPGCWVLDESARAAQRLYRSYLGPDGSVESDAAAPALAMFDEARNGRTLPRIGYGADLVYCAAIDRSAVVPRLVRRDDRFVLVDGG